MKRLFILIIVVVLLSACGADSTSQEGLTGAVGIGDGSETAVSFSEFTANKVWTDMRPLSATNRATVIFRMELAEDAFGSGDEAPFYVYGAGLMQVEEKDFLFADNTPITGESTGEINGFQFNPANGDSLVLGDGNTLSLTAQIDGIILNSQAKQINDVHLLGLASTETAQISSILVNNENVMLPLASFQCEGRMIPGSSMASLTYIGETEKGQVFIGTGIGGFADMPPAKSDITFDCNMEGRGGIISQTALIDVEGAHIVDLVIDGLKVRTDDGQTSSIFKVYVGGFHMGDGRQSLNFNIGMPPS